MSQQKGIDIYFFGSSFFTSSRTDKFNGDQGVYKEIRVQGDLNKYFSIGIFLGHQIRSKGEYLINFIDVPGLYVYEEIFSVINRNYIPVGVFTEINLTEYFANELKLIKRSTPWKLYNNIQLVYLGGYDVHDRKVSNGNYISGPFVIQNDYGRAYIGFMFGARRYLNKRRSFSVTIEAGKGALMNAQLGLGLHFTRQRQ